MRGGGVRGTLRSGLDACAADEAWRQPDDTSEGGITALMAAAFHGESKALEVLLAQPRIDINRATPNHLNTGFFKIQLEGRHPPLVFGSRTALMFASLGGSAGATSLLIAHGARIQQKDAEGLEAAEYAHSAAVTELFSEAARTSADRGKR